MIGKLKKFLFGEDSLRQTLAKNSFWSTVSNFGSHLIKLIIIIYAARLLGAEQYGLFSYALSVAGTFTILSDLGLNYLFFINIARRDENEPAYFPTLIFLRAGLIGAVIFLTVAVGPLLTKFPEAQILIPLVALLMAFDDVRAFLNGFARAENRIDKEAFGNIITNILIVVFSLIALRYSPTSYMLTATYLAGSALGTFAVFFIIKKDVKRIFHSLAFSFPLAKNILAVAVPFGLANTMWILMTSTDALVIGWFRTASELGYYAAAQRPIMAFSLIPSIIVASSLAIIARLAKEEAKDRLKTLIERLTTFSLAIVFPLALGGIIIAPSMIHFLYGAEYMPATLSFQLLFATLVISYPAAVITNLVLAFKQQKTFTIAMVAGAAGNLLLDILLIPPFGIVGSVVATIGALGIINGYIWYSARKLQPFEIVPFVPRILAATAIMGSATFMLQIASVNFFVNIIISACLYLGILIIAREPLLKDVRGLFRQ
ncbi:MAG: flippase [Patescibacteria group bacterium]